jgi:nicotinamidase-related amidase
MNSPDIKPNKTALLLVDMQNDFFFKKGAYQRAGFVLPGASDLVRQLAELTSAARETAVNIISSQFTLLQGRHGEPLISDSLKAARPFLGKGDFCPGDFGHRLIEELAPADYTVDKISFSAFYMTCLDFILQKKGIDTLFIGGIVTNGGVASTVRDAHTRGYRTFVLSDGCAAFSEEAHHDTLKSLSYLVPLIGCDEVVDLLDEF